MGSIQNSINQVLGTVAGAATMGKHISQQKEANELAKINATDKAIDEYVQSGKDAMKSITETEGIEKEIHNIDKQQEMFSDEETWSEEPEGPQAMAYESAKQSLRNIISAKRYQDNLIKLRMNLQDEKWKVLGIDKETLKTLNSPEEQSKIHKFRGGKK